MCRLLLLLLLCCALCSILSSECGFKSWYSTALSRLSTVEPLTSIKVDARYGGLPEGIMGSMVNTDVTFRSEAYETPSLAYFRMVSFSADNGGYNVFNLMALPRLHAPLPIFSADIVVLPGGLLAAIDFQPARDASLSINSEYFESSFYTEHKAAFTMVTSPLPAGGALPIEAHRYFSPYALWTRTAMKDIMEGHNDVFDTVYMQNVEKAFYSYIDAYIHTIEGIQATDDDENRSGGVVGEDNKASADGCLTLPCKTFLSEYLEYRIDKDPARNMLVGSFGEDWTEEMLRAVLFPTSVL